jgi:hypothetical protein
MRAKPELPATPATRAKHVRAALANFCTAQAARNLQRTDDLHRGTLIL